MDKVKYLELGKFIVNTLNNFTYEAYFIGGVVRDYLLKVEFNDIDIVTSATPEQVKFLFPEATIENAELGRTIYKKDEYVFEITTFREEYYTKPRKPSKVHYSNSLQSDILRRDFTINALAMTDRMKIIDFVGGKKDVKHKLVRFIGNPRQRIEQDPLRVLRAFNLVARFKCSIEENTAKGISKSTKLYDTISSFHVTEELNKIFNAKYGHRAIKLMNDYGFSKGLTDYRKGLKIVAKKYKKLNLEEKFLVCYITAGHIPDNTCFDRYQLRRFNMILEACEELSTKEVDKKLVYKYGTEIITSADKLNLYTIKKYKSQKKAISVIGCNLPIVAISDLKVNGDDISNLAKGQKGAFIGEILNTLQYEVIEGKIANEKNILLSRAETLLNHEKVLENNDTKVSNEEVNDLSALKNKYLKEFDELVQEAKKGRAEFDIEIIKKQVKHNLLEQKKEYRVLEKAGLI